MTFFLPLTFDSHLALLFCWILCFFWLWLFPGPFWFVCYLDFDPCIPHDSDFCPALMIRSPQYLTRFWPYSTTLTVILFWPSTLCAVTLVKLACRQLVCTLPTGHGLLFCFLIFPLFFLKVILGGDLISVGGWQYATSSPVSLWRLAEVYVALFRQIGPELLIGLWCYFSFPLHSISPFSLFFTLSRSDPRLGCNRIWGSSKLNCRLVEAELVIRHLNMAKFDFEDFVLCPTVEQFDRCRKDDLLLLAVRINGRSRLCCMRS